MSHRVSNHLPLNVLFILPPCLPTPPVGYGGIEAVAAALLPELEAAGIRTTVCTPIGSTVQVTKRLELTEPLYPILSHAYNEVVPGVELYISRIMDAVWGGDFDIIHDFSGMLSILNTVAAPMRASRTYPPVIHTIHGPIAPYVETYTNLLAAKNLTYTGISQAQMADAPARMKASTEIIYNGLKPSDYTVGDGSGELLVLGRICHDKGQDRLIEYCAASGTKLEVAGTVAELSTVEEIEAEYAKGPESTIGRKADFQTYTKIRHLIDGEVIRFHGNVGGELKTHLLGSAPALVVPNRWSEPFGMVAIEAMASGTPVVAMNTGAMPELIKHGVTGYLADTFDELCEYLKPEAIAKLDRAACRQHVEDNFSIRAIAQDFISFYNKSVAVPELWPAPSRVSSPNRQILAPMYEQLPRSQAKKNRRLS